MKTAWLDQTEIIQIHGRGNERHQKKTHQLSYLQNVSACGQKLETRQRCESSFIPHRKLISTILPFKVTGLEVLSREGQADSSLSFGKAQKSSSAFWLLEDLSSFRRWMHSSTLRSPWTLLSRVRTFTVLLVFSFSPTTFPWRETCKKDKKKGNQYLDRQSGRDNDKDSGISDRRVCCHWPRMKLYWANCAFLIFLFRVHPGSRSTSVIKPLLWNSCWTCHINQRNNQQLKTGESMSANYY